VPVSQHLVGTEGKTIESWNTLSNQFWLQYIPKAYKICGNMESFGVSLVLGGCVYIVVKCLLG